MLIKVFRSGEIEGDYFVNLCEVEQKLLPAYIERKEREAEELREKAQEWQEKRGGKEEKGAGMAEKRGGKEEKAAEGEGKEKQKPSPRLGKEKVVYTEEEKRILLEKIIALRTQGAGWRKIAEKLHIAPQTARRWYKEA